MRSIISIVAMAITSIIILVTSANADEYRIDTLQINGSNITINIDKVDNNNYYYDIVLNERLIGTRNNDNVEVITGEKFNRISIRGTHLLNKRNSIIHGHMNKYDLIELISWFKSTSNNSRIGFTVISHDGYEHTAIRFGNNQAIGNAIAELMFK